MVTQKFKVAGAHVHTCQNSFSVSVSKAANEAAPGHMKPLLVQREPTKRLRSSASRLQDVPGWLLKQVKHYFTTPPKAACNFSV